MSAIANERPSVLPLRQAFCFTAAAGGLAVLYARNPSIDPGFPPCPFHYCTGLYCPGCGALRAIHSLLHGHWMAAWNFNPMFVLLIPFVAALLLEDARWTPWLPQRLRIRVPTGLKRTAPWVVMIFFVLRNLPWHPFTLLAPH